MGKGKAVGDLVTSRFLPAVGLTTVELYLQLPKPFSGPSERLATASGFVDGSLGTYGFRWEARRSIPSFGDQ
jgi:hypothetical protein